MSLTVILHRSGNKNCVEALLPVLAKFGDIDIKLISDSAIPHNVVKFAKSSTVLRQSKEMETPFIIKAINMVNLIKTKYVMVYDVSMELKCKLYEHIEPSRYDEVVTIGGIDTMPYPYFYFGDALTVKNIVNIVGYDTPWLSKHYNYTSEEFVKFSFALTKWNYFALENKTLELK